VLLGRSAATIVSNAGCRSSSSSITTATRLSARGEDRELLWDSAPPRRSLFAASSHRAPTPPRHRARTGLGTRGGTDNVIGRESAREPGVSAIRVADSGWWSWAV